MPYLCARQIHLIYKLHEMQTSSSHNPQILLKNYKNSEQCIVPLSSTIIILHSFFCIFDNQLAFNKFPRFPRFPKLPRVPNHPKNTVLHIIA